MLLRGGFGAHSRAIDVYVAGGEPVAAISIGRRKRVIISACDMDVLEDHALYAHPRVDGNYVARSSLDKRLLHRILLSPDPDQQIDHVSGVALDNTRGNLRPCSPRQNIAARSGLAKYRGMVGVKRSKAGIYSAFDYELGRYVGGRGKFGSLEDAALYRDESALEAFCIRESGEPLHSYGFIDWNYEEPAEAVESELYLEDALETSKESGFQYLSDKGWLSALS